MLYGYAEMLDNRVATLVVAADTVDEFTAWIATVQEQDPAARNFNEIYTSTFLDHMTQPTYKGYKHAVYAFYHNDEEQRAAFIAEHNIQELQSNPARDRHHDMLHKAKVAHEERTQTDEQKAMTIEELSGLDKHDPWDRRSDEEKEADKAMKEEMKKLRKEGKLSGDSFGGADDLREARAHERYKDAVAGKISRSQAAETLADMDYDPADIENLTDPNETSLDELKELLEDEGIEGIEVMEDADYDAMVEAARAVAKNGTVHVTDINGSTGEDGTFDIDNVLAVKHGGEVDEEVVEARAAEAAAKPKKVFSPDDFAEVLRGDGSADHINVKGDPKMRRGEGLSRPSLSDHAEAERKVYQEAQAAAEAERKAKQKIADDEQGLKDREAGVFKGSDLAGDEQVPFDSLPAGMQEELEKAGMKKESYPFKDYPYNSELGGRVLLPGGMGRSLGKVQVYGGWNVVKEGDVTMGDQSVTVMSKENKDDESWAVYGRSRQVVVPAAEDSTDEPSVELTTDIWLVRIR